MSKQRVTAAALGLFLALAAVMKLIQFDGVTRDAATLLRSVHLPELSNVTIGYGVLALALGEIVLGGLMVLGFWRRAGLGSMLGLMGAGIVVVGAASSWGLDQGFGCPCGLTLDVPFMRNTYAILLVRDACLVALVAVAWPDA